VGGVKFPGISSTNRASVWSVVNELGDGVQAVSTINLAGASAEDLAKGVNVMFPVPSDEGAMDCVTVDEQLKPRYAEGEEPCETTQGSTTVECQCNGFLDGITRVVVKTRPTTAPREEGTEEPGEDSVNGDGNGGDVDDDKGRMQGGEQAQGSSSTMVGGVEDDHFYYILAGSLGGAGLLVGGFIYYRMKNKPSMIRATPTDKKGKKGIKMGKMGKNTKRNIRLQRSPSLKGGVTRKSSRASGLVITKKGRIPKSRGKIVKRATGFNQAVTIHSNTPRNSETPPQALGDVTFHHHKNFDVQKQGNNTGSPKSSPKFSPNKQHKHHQVPLEEQPLVGAEENNHADTLDSPVSLGSSFRKAMTPHDFD